MKRSTKYVALDVHQANYGRLSAGEKTRTERWSMDFVSDALADGAPFAASPWSTTLRANVRRSKLGTPCRRGA